MISLLSKIDFLKGVGPKLQGVIDYVCGGTSIAQLIFHIPNRFIVRKSIINPLEAKSGDIVIIQGNVVSINAQKNKIYKVKIINSNKCIFDVVFFKFSFEYLNNLFKQNKEFIISGVLSEFATITHPEYILTAKEHLYKIPLLTPIYSLTKGISNKIFIKIISQALELIPEKKEWIPNKILTKQGWKSWKSSLKSIHMPKSSYDFECARKRLAYDELLINQFRLIKMRKKTIHGISICSNKILANNLLKKQNFRLTQGQINAVNDIYIDQKQCKPMLRLLQGDVGCGKTIVAMLAILNAIESGYQAVFMVPTELLAKQHYSWAINNIDIEVALLTSNNKKKSTIQNISSGFTKLVIGTHALFQEKITFNKVGIVVIDEQHRFGVLQRAKLAKKCLGADILFMSATPIPRTMSLVHYGDMDISTITDKPSGRIPITTSIMSDKNIDEIINKIISIKAKAYWICPSIEESENIKCSAAENRFEYIHDNYSKKHNHPILLAHGRMKEIDRNKALDNFCSLETGILVATTVVEVGIDIKDANIIVIENAERFGLAQLHQLRGRVGRNNIESFCILMYSGSSKNSINRLKILKESNDGFYIAEQDLKIRGSGELTGTMQSGWHNFIFARLYEDQEQIIEARSQAKLQMEILQSNNDFLMLEKALLKSDPVNI